MGIYVLRDGTYIHLQIEPVQWRKRSFGGVSTSGGVSKTTLKADMQKRESLVQLSGSPEFLLVCPDGVVAMEYHLLRAEPKKKGREFRVRHQFLQGDLGGTRKNDVYVSATRKNKVPFKEQRLETGKFRLTVPELGKGEYAFLPPTKGFNSNLYTFGVR